jgi:hypothetical protein
MPIMHPEIRNSIPMDVSNFPQSIQLLITLIGVDAAMLLVEFYAGKTIRLYERGDSRASLANVIGEAAAEKLFRHFGGDPIAVSSCSAVAKNVRNLRIHELHDNLIDKGITVRKAIIEIIDQFGLTERTVRRILKKTTFAIAPVEHVSC